MANLTCDGVFKNGDITIFSHDEDMILRHLRFEKAECIKLTNGGQYDEALGYSVNTIDITFLAKALAIDETNIEEQKTNPDRAGGDIYISKEVWNDPSLAHHVIVEEMIHAAQFDNIVSLEDAQKFKYEKAYTVDSTGNREFEAKMLVGIINYQSGIPQYKTRQDETGYAQRFGVYFYLHIAGTPNASKEYFRHLDRWKVFLNSIGSNYGKFGFDKTVPSILKF